MKARLQALGDVLLGSERRLRIRSARCLLACALMAYSVASLGYFVAVGLAERGPVLALALLGVGGMLLFYAAIRSGASERLRDPSLTIAQMSFALLVGALAYTLAGRGRGAVFPIMMVVLMFGLYSLTPRQVRLMSALALALFGAAMALMAWRNPRVYRPEVEFAHFLVIAIILPAVSMLAGQLGQLRDALKRQKAELREALARNQALAQRDELTGLANRRGFGTHIEQRRRNSTLAGLSLILIDCDRFKHVNDTHGHLAGDRVLQSVANLLRAVAGPEDIACRLGGDEFCLLVHGDRREDLERMADYILASARALMRMHSNPPQMTTLSLGACSLGPGQNWEHWYTQADTALYRAKRLGGDRVEWQD